MTEQLIGSLALRARAIARLNYDHGRENVGTWEDAVVMHLAIAQALREIPQVDRGRSSEP